MNNGWYLRSSEPSIVESLVASLVSSKNTVLSKLNSKHPMLGQYRQFFASMDVPCDRRAYYVMEVSVNVV